MHSSPPFDLLFALSQIQMNWPMGGKSMQRTVVIRALVGRYVAFHRYPDPCRCLSLFVRKHGGARSNDDEVNEARGLLPSRPFATQITHSHSNINQPISAYTFGY